MQDFYVLVWSVNTYGLSATLPEESQDSLKKTIETASRVKDEVDVVGLLSIMDQWTQGGLPQAGQAAAPWGIFVAPEYMFSAAPQPSNGSAAPVPSVSASGLSLFEESEKDALRTSLEQMSATFPGLVIVPGTVVWRKPFFRVSKPHKPQDRHIKAWRSVTKHADDFYAKNYDWQLAQGGLTTRQKSEMLYEYGKFASNPQAYTWNGVTPVPLYMSRNTAFILYDGRTILKYNKRGDFHEATGPDNDTVFIPGSKVGQVTIKTTGIAPRNVNLAIEICMDHPLGTAARDIQASTPVDIQILTSAWTSTDPQKLALKDGGLFVHASTNANATGVKRKDGGVFTDVPVFKTVSANGGILSVYKLQLP